MRARPREESDRLHRLVGVNSAISYMSAAQAHADAIRAGHRDPHPRVEKPKTVEAAPQRRPVFGWRALLVGRL